MNWAAIIWLGLTVVFLIAEASTVTVIALWFAAGSLAAMTAALFGGAIWIQALTFLVVSAAALTALRPLVRKYLTPKLTATNIDAALIHEAAIGKIAGEQLIKLMTLGLTEQEAEEQIVNGFLK